MLNPINSTLISFAQVVEKYKMAMGIPVSKTRQIKAEEIIVPRSRHVPDMLRIARLIFCKLPHSRHIPDMLPEAKFNIQTSFVVLAQKSSLRSSVQKLQTNGDYY